MVRKLIPPLVLASVSTGCGQPSRAPTYYDQGNNHLDKGDYDQAIADYEKAIQLKSDFATAYYNRGQVLKEQAKNTEAIADLKKAVELTSDPGLRKTVEQALRELGVK